jgi:response regulator RpfG family c-di-GMP phosphodiesterase
MASPTRARADRPRILCVDDEPYILESLQDTLHRSFKVVTATGGAEGLALLGQGPNDFSVVISDMRMPVMPGNVFLREARSVAPDATRILLTGHADLDAAVSAINQGQLFRFLTKPCPAQDLIATCEEAVEQNRLKTAERVLLEQTLKGSVDALSEVLALASPAAFGRSASVRKLVARLAASLELEESWAIEVAALLAQLGAVTLPPETAEKLYAGTTLPPGEQEMVDRVPEVTQQILQHIPRLEGVLEILANYSRPYSEHGAGRSLSIGARILRIAVDYDALEAHGSEPAIALGVLRGRGTTYDLDLVAALSKLIGDEDGPRQVVERPLAGLKPGMMLADDVRSTAGNLLIARGHVATEQLIARLMNLNTGSVREPLMVIEG